MKSNTNQKREVKKSPKYKLENFSKLFLQMGLVVTLLIIFVLFENKTEVFSPNTKKDTSVATAEEYIMEFEEIEEEEQPEEEQPEEVVPEVEIHDIEQKEDDEEIADVIFEESKDQEIEATTEGGFDEEEHKAPKTKMTSEVSFIKIEQAPMFPGCEKEKGKAAQKKCLQKKIQSHVSRNFNADLAQDLGLDTGRKRIMVQFKIDQKGNVTNIMAKAPHPRLKQEAVRIIKKLPIMKPGMQRNQPVIVKYALPIQFDVE